MLIPKNDAHRLLQPIHRTFDESMRDGWVLWEEVRALRPSFFDRPRDAMVNGEAARLLVERLQGRPEVDLYERHEQVIVAVKDVSGNVQLLARVKKLNKNLHFSNYPTRRARRMKNQEKISNLPDAPMVVVGYQLDELETTITATWVLLAEGAHVHWSYRLDHTISGTVIQPSFFDLPGFAVASNEDSGDTGDRPGFVVAPKLPKAPANDAGKGGGSSE